MTSTNNIPSGNYIPFDMQYIIDTGMLHGIVPFNQSRNQVPKFESYTIAKCYGCGKFFRAPSVLNFGPIECPHCQIIGEF